jgi:hypothetical protein
MSDYTKIKRSQIATFIDTTPAGSTRTYKIMGFGVTNYAISYNPQTETEQWIVDDNATTNVTGNQKSGDVEQRMYKGEPCFEYINSLRDKIGSDIETTALDVDMWDATGSAYKAKQQKVTIAVTSYGGETNPTIGYTLYYNGDPIEGTVTIADGVPTFTPNVSL